MTDVIIVGAGLSGLSAARALSQRDLKVVVLEATDRVGGRTLTVKPGEGDPQYGWADVGASYVGPTQHHVLRMCEELGVENYLCSDELTSILYSKGKASSLDGAVPALWLSNPLAAWDLAVMVRRLEKMCWEVPVDKPWEAPHAKEWDNMTVKQFYDKHCWTRQCQEFLNSMSSMDNTAEQYEMSLLFYLWYMRQGNGPRKLWSVTGGAQERKLVGGTQQLSVKIAEQLGKSVVLSQPVVMVRHGPDDVTVKTLDGTEYNAKYLILATPPITQMKIHFDPPLPLTRSCLIQRSPMGLVMKFVIFYEEPFWEQNGFNGYVACADGVEVVGLTTEDRKPGVKLSGIICFIYMIHMVNLSQMNDEDKLKAICKSLAKIFKSEKALKPVHAVHKVWPAEPYVCGGYTCYYPPGAMTLFGPAMRAPIGPRVFLAGTETATHWTGYMNGAIDAGQRAAREVLHAAGLIEESEVWVQHPPSRDKIRRMEELIPTIESTLCAVMAVGVALLMYWLVMFSSN